MFKVRVRNFQSIKDSKITVEGLTVITGANNSGKTSLMRAIRGVFENSPFGSLLRKGEDKITVDLEFDDGRTVTWEKGPKHNAYTIDGYKLSGVGRGAPEELKDLGVHSMVAANNVVWPQVANQFDGTIFLLNRPGSVLAEALSDIEKVGKLTSALRLSEKDRRSVNSELKVRRKDLIEQENMMSLYKGFESVEEDMESLHSQRKTLSKKASEYNLIEGLYKRLEVCRKAVRAFEGFNPNMLPEKERVQKIHRAHTLVQRLNISKDKAENNYSRYKDFKVFDLPKENDILVLLKSIKQVSNFSLLRNRKQEDYIKYRSFKPPELPKEEEHRAQVNLKEVLRGFLKRKKSAETLKEEFNSQSKNLIEKQALVVALVVELLGDLGECPVCRKPHNGGC